MKLQYLTPKVDCIWTLATDVLTASPSDSSDPFENDISWDV